MTMSHKGPTQKKKKSILKGLIVLHSETIPPTKQVPMEKFGYPSQLRSIVHNPFY